MKLFFFSIIVVVLADCSKQDDVVGGQNNNNNTQLTTPELSIALNCPDELVVAANGMYIIGYVITGGDANTKVYVTTQDGYI